MKTKELLMAVDLGTSFVKAGIYDLDSTCIAITDEPVKDERPAPGIFIQHGEELVASVLRCMKKASDTVGERAGDIAAIAFTGQMAGFMGVDKDWNDVTGWSCSLDTRYAPFAKKQMEELSEEFLSISGTNSPMFSTKYEWFRHDFPDEAKRIAKYMMLSSYVAGKLSGAPIDEAAIDGSLIAWTGLADIKGRGWSDVICEKLKINKDHLPRVCQSHEIVGYLSKEAAQAASLKDGIPLVSGAGDKIAGCVGAGVLGKGDMIFEAGSYAGLSCFVDDFRPDYEERYYDILDGTSAGDLYAHTYLPGSGITLDWFINNFMVNDSLGKKDAFRLIDEEAGAIPPGCEGLMSIGMLGGTAMPFNSDLKGIWMGANWAHTRAHFYRALLESFSFATATVIKRIDANYPNLISDRVRVIGGGAKSAVWPQMLADVTGRTFERLDREDIALWGVCMLAAKGIGLVDDIRKKASECVHVKQSFIPDPSKADIYEQLRQQYTRYEKELTPYCAGLIVPEQTS